MGKFRAQAQSFALQEYAALFNHRLHRRKGLGREADFRADTQT